jgi:hypothetical protein
MNIEQTREIVRRFVAQARPTAAPKRKHLEDDLEDEGSISRQSQGSVKLLKDDTHEDEDAVPRQLQGSVVGWEAC